jgi:hypothetical protein
LPPGPESPSAKCRDPAAVPSPTAAALELLASCRDGCTEAMMFAHGFSIDMMVDLVNAGLATAKAERVVAGSKTMEVARVRITEAGRAHVQPAAAQFAARPLRQAVAPLLVDRRRPSP